VKFKLPDGGAARRAMEDIFPESEVTQLSYGLAGSSPRIAG
jgi:hypothetical protein